jgi:hypothetical protein
MNNQVIINVTLFKEKNLNYFFLNIDEKLFKNNLNNNSYFKNRSFRNNKIIIK